MSWTVACFCGAVYQADPDGQCPVCVEPLPESTGHAWRVREPISSAPSAPREPQREVVGAPA